MAYRAGAFSASADTTLPRNRAVDSLGLTEALHLGFRGEAAGFLSRAGLPPVAGNLALGEHGLTFIPAGGGPALPYPLYRVRQRDGGTVRVPSLRLFDTRPSGADSVYFFRLDGAVFETQGPGLFRLLVDHPEWLDSLRQDLPPAMPTLVALGDTAAAYHLIDSLSATPYADSLYQLFGAPAHPVGLVGSHGRAAGRLGEYIASRDSVSLSPTHMESMSQLRHSLAHELAHRWQRRAPRTVRALWRGVPPIADSLRYGYDDEQEHQAEAVAFAVSFLQTTARPDMSAADRLALLAAYERLVPGTRTMARYLLTRPVYRHHPLTGQLTAPTGIASARRGH
ncbi:MAG TPA: hypothetical protein VFL95_09125 [Gemmatimonadales bacterium]|nr:hypothetical protein [Gemmatimonadales bacterium]